MIRSPHRVLEGLNTSASVPRHVVRPSRFSAWRLDLALTPAQRHLEVPVVRFSAPPPEGLALRGRIGSRAPARLEDVPSRTRVVTHVPSLKAPRRFPVASIDLSRTDVALPFGIGRFISAATLKALAGGSPFDRLLKKTETGWQFVNNDACIDLQDNTQEFRLGQLTIFS
jgi:hypothetical protein